MLRFFDIIIALVATILCALPALILMIVIPATSSGPAIFRQQRVGRNRMAFTCYKFRTMAKDTRNVASHEVGAAAITPLGHFLRRTKLDEIPQLVNVLKGEMSFVGPRPCLPVQEELVAERNARGLYALRPGITGPAQVRGIDMSDPVKLAKADTAWLNEAGVIAYLRYIIMTATGAGSGDAAKK